jgi:hypothetical protein
MLTISKNALLNENSLITDPITKMVAHTFEQMQLTHQKLSVKLPTRIRRPCTVKLDFLLDFCYHRVTQSALRHSCGIASFKILTFFGTTLCPPCHPCTVIFDVFMCFCYHRGPRIALTHSCGIASFKMAPAGEIFVLRSKFVLGPWKFDLCKRTVSKYDNIASVLSNHFALLQKHVVLG